MKLAAHLASVWPAVAPAVRPVLGLAGLSALLSACAVAPASAEESVEQSRSAVIRGKASTSEQDAVVLLMHYDPATHGFGSCTGTLLAPNVVLTARHCVASTDAYSACDVEGKPLAGGAVRKSHKPETMLVYTGKDRPDFSSHEGLENPAGRGMEILDNGSTTICNGDIALIVLEAPIEGAQIAPIRLESDVEKGELITAIGWGVTERTPSPLVRQQRTGIKITSVGPDKAQFPGVPPNEFQVGESICSGDSGGPAIASTGAVVGVVSRGGNPDSNPDSQNPASNCIAATNLYTKVFPFNDLVLEAFAVAEAEPWLEGGPDPRLAKAGVECTDASECRSDLCLDDPGTSKTTCAAECAADSECPSSQKCVAVDDLKVCRTPKKEEVDAGLCSGSPGRPVDGTVVAFGVALALAGFGRRGRRR